MAAMTFDSTLSTAELTARYPGQIPVFCTHAGSSKKARNQALLLPQAATVSALTAALQETLGTKKAVHVFVDGAAPAKETALSDLCVNGSVNVTYNVEGRFGDTTTSACASGGSY